MAGVDACAVAVRVSAGRVAGSAVVRVGVAGRVGVAVIVAVDVAVGVGVAVAVTVSVGVAVAVGGGVNVGGRVGAGSPGARNVAQASALIARRRTHRPRT